MALITLANLRGIRESGTMFAIPTYFFIFSFGGMVACRLDPHRARERTCTPARSRTRLRPASRRLGLFVLLRAFASGCAALTGIEAVANGVPSFQPPESKNAATTQVWMAAILMAFFVGVTVLAHEMGIVPSESKTVVSQIAEGVFGHNILFFIMQGSTTLILLLAANTAFAGLPVLASVMARDSAMPKQFAFRGDRLAFSNGIVMLGIASAAVLFAFGAQTHKIIPLYAFGVFMAFTLVAGRHGDPLEAPPGAGLEALRRRQRRRRRRNRLSLRSSSAAPSSRTAPGYRSQSCSRWPSSAG